MTLRKLAPYSKLIMKFDKVFNSKNEIFVKAKENIKELPEFPR